MQHTYSTRSISQALLDELAQALQHVGPYGSVEIYVQNNVVTQITMRNIKKTDITDRNAHTKQLHR